MILTADVGNTNIVFGVFDKDELILDSRMDTNRHRMADQYAITIAQLFSLYEIKPKNIEGAVISSVVPPVSDQLKIAIKKVFGFSPLMVGTGVKTGLDIRIDDPSTLGADLACGGAAAKALYTLPCIVVDLGTATKIYVIDAKGAFIGGIVAPGIKISLEALAGGTTLLPMISLEGETEVIGRNTVDCMRSGVLYGHAGMIDSFIKKFQREIGKSTVIATGGFSSVIKDYCESEFMVDKDLVLKGLKIIYEKNRKK